MCGSCGSPLRFLVYAESVRCAWTLRGSRFELAAPQHRPSRHLHAAARYRGRVSVGGFLLATRLAAPETRRKRLSRQRFVIVALRASALLIVALSSASSLWPSSELQSVALIRAAIIARITALTE